MFLEIRHLRSIKAIDETGSLAQAAERLHLTQSALSHQIKAVENYFGVSLYQRKHKPLRLSRAGQRLLNLAQQLMPEVEAAEYELKHLAGVDSGRLHITIECHSCIEWLVPTLDHYRKRWPEVEVDIRLGNNFEPMNALVQEQVDLVITTDIQKSPDIAYESLFDYEALCVMSNNHPLTRKQCLSAKDFTDQTLITYPVEQSRLDIFTEFLNPEKVAPQQIRQCELTVMMLQLVVSNRGLAVLPDWVVREYMQQKKLSVRPLGKKGLKGTLYAAVREQEKTHEYIQDFIQLAQQGLYL